MYREIDYIDLSKVFPEVRIERASYIWKYVYIGIAVVCALLLIALLINKGFI